MSDKDIILCRCEDVSREDVRKQLEQGFTTFEDLKRQLRVGMGPCQGQTCGDLIRREIALFLHKNPDEIPTQKVRPMTIGVKLKTIQEGTEDES